MTHIPNQPINIGSRRELFVDSLLVENLGGGAMRRLNSPRPREGVLQLDNSWERGGYITVFQDRDIYRMYYQGVSAGNCPDRSLPWFGSDDTIICYAESRDGIRWERPSLQMHSFCGSKDNNIVYVGKGSHGFAPFIDTCPGCPPEERYKAFGQSRIIEKTSQGDKDYWRLLFLLSSPDGLNWTIKEGPKRHGAILDRDDGHFDSQNVGFWDEQSSLYRLYFRWRRPLDERKDLSGRDEGEGGRSRRPEIRDTATGVSANLMEWKDLALLDYPGSPLEEMYTNQVSPYYRAPHIYLGFPSRYVENRGPISEWHRMMMEEQPGRYFQSYTDGLFMSSRDGRTFQRWNEAFLRPGMPEESHWGYGECFQGRGLLETTSEDSAASREISFFVTEGRRPCDHTDSGRRSKRITRRYTIRPDGFVSINAPLSGGELLTHPIIFQGDRLSLNMATSAAGSIRVEIRAEDSSALPGFELENCPDIFGNSLDRVIAWKSQGKLEQLAGQPVRLFFSLKDADLYSFRFGSANPSSIRRATG